MTSAAAPCSSLRGLLCNRSCRADDCFARSLLRQRAAAQCGHRRRYGNFIKERFERCLDLYLCPRTSKVRKPIRKRKRKRAAS